ncbi:MAG TPA: DUF1295 domain-containing protein, partial [Gemmatales bacterium]|nr:DUF1295 domain-containing protein [Gemmatales bacterium]
MIQQLIINFASVTLWMILFWTISIPLRNVAIVDIAWGLGFILVATITYFLSPVNNSTALLVLLLIILWGARLSIYLFWRNRDKPEDKRYRAIRERQGEGFHIKSLWIIFLPQGVLIWLVSLPVQVGFLEPQVP